MELDRYGEQRPVFAAWLLLQRDREDGVGRLAQAARSDRSFPREGNADAVRAHLNRMQADGESFEAVDDAELDWLSY
jgi:hypothetical protein